MALASTSLRTTSVPRRMPKRASHTWPGTTTSANHFEDFLREIGESTEVAHLCCIPRPSATPCPHAHLHKRSTSDVQSKARSSSKATHPSAVDVEATLSPSPNMHAHPAQLQKPTQTRPELAARGRTMSTPKTPLVSGTLTSGLPVPLSMATKSPALSAIDLENHDASATHGYFSSARDTLLSCMGSIPVEERRRPSTRAPTRPALARSSSSSSSSPSSPVSGNGPDSSPSPSAPAAPARGRVLGSSSSFPRRASGSSQSSTSTTGSSQRSQRFSIAHRGPRAGRSSSRTPSIDSIDTASSSSSSSSAPATPHSPPTALPGMAGAGPGPSTSLEELERTSRFRVPGVCVACKRTGANYPSCAKCGERWCSRECRVGAGGGGAGGGAAGVHVCRARGASA